MLMLNYPNDHKNQNKKIRILPKIVVILVLGTQEHLELGLIVQKDPKHDVIILRQTFVRHYWCATIAFHDPVLFAKIRSMRIQYTIIISAKIVVQPACLLHL